MSCSFIMTILSLTINSAYNFNLVCTKLFFFKFLFSVTYSVKTVKFQWHPDPIALSASIVLPQFRLVRNETDDCTGRNKDSTKDLYKSTSSSPSHLISLTLSPSPSFQHILTGFCRSSRLQLSALIHLNSLRNTFIHL